jgi:putative transposase
MPSIVDPFRFVVIAVAGWMNQKQQHAIDYLREENRILREQLGTRRLRFTDDQRRRLATKAKLTGAGGPDGSGESGLGISEDCRCPVESRSQSCPRHDRKHTEETRHRTAPDRIRKTTWKEFLTQHWEVIVAADFFTVEVQTRHGLQRYIVLFFMESSGCPNGKGAH